MSTDAASQQMVIRIGKRRQLVFCDDCLQTPPGRRATGVDAHTVDIGSGDWGRGGTGSDSTIGSLSWQVGSNPPLGRL